ncbi:MAG: redoxin family protein [Planctomycetes bacterium]|nr:redoxin family protein [Planctomycetota bacterium]
MNRSTARLVLAFLVLLGTAAPRSRGQGDEDASGRMVASSEEASRAHLGERFEDMVLKGLDGKEQRWSDHAGKKATLFVLRDSTCPLCRKYGPSLARLEKEQAERLRVVYLNPMDHETLEMMKGEVADFELTGLYHADRGQVIARKLAATSTTEVFLFDAERRLRYRGALDDQYGLGYALDAPRVRFALDALDAILAGRDPKPAATTAPGCMLALEVEKKEEPSITFHGRISRIMQKYCQRCHREGENAPFELVTYDDVASRKGMIRFTLKKNLMPPWYAADEVGGPWLDDLRMPEAEKKALLDWIENGCPEGDPAGAPEPLPYTEGWKIGTPDAVISVERKIRVPAEGDIPYKYEVIETDFPEDKWIEKIELRSDHPEVVHHILVFYHYDEHLDSNPQFLGHLALQGFFAIHSPGVEPIEYPADRAKLLKKRQRLLFQIHYNAIGKEVWDRPRIGFKFRDGPPKYSIRCNAASTREIHLPPRTKDVVVPAEFTFPSKSRIFGYVPHMHARGQAFAMDLFYPDGKEERVLWVPHFDFNWQQAYRLQKPYDVPAGTRIRATGWFDNTAGNPANPNPDTDVYFGLQTDDEMMIGYFEWMALD